MWNIIVLSSKIVFTYYQIGDTHQENVSYTLSGLPQVSNTDMQVSYHIGKQMNMRNTMLFIADSALNVDHMELICKTSLLWKEIISLYHCLTWLIYMSWKKNGEVMEEFDIFMFCTKAYVYSNGKWDN